jgi:2-oxo-4-hydroxy-4-carboxy-5-ureidoimidazoline decarboxylase
MNVADFNALTIEEARQALTRCCGSHRWVERMLACRPFATTEALLREAAEVWNVLERRDWLEAFAAHPRIGERLAEADKWCGDEQAGVATAEGALQCELREANRDYEERFGCTFIVCATGKSAAEMLAILRSRLGNEPDRELRIAAAEQLKITCLRLEKL